MTIPYDREERVEDAFVSYLTAAVTPSVPMKIYPAYDTGAIQFPCAVVRAGHTQKVGDEKGAWSTAFAVTVEIAILVEAVKVVNEQAVALSGVRDQNRNCRNAVLTALAIEDTDAGPADLATVVQADSGDMPKGLAAYLVYQKIDGIWIKCAQMRDADRDVEPEKRCLKTIVQVAVIAQPVQLGGY